MGKQFINVHTTVNGLTIGLLRPSLLDFHESHIDAYTQGDCVMRFSVNVASSTAAVMLLLGSQNGDIIETYLSFARSDVQYYDMTEPLRCWLQRKMQNYTIALTYTEYKLKIVELDIDGAEIGSTFYTLRAYDAPEPIDVKFSAALPDTFRMLTDASFGDHTLACVRAIASTCRAEILLADGTVQEYYTGIGDDLYTAGFRFMYYPTNAPAVVRVGGGANYETARVDWIQCFDNMAQLRWWSPSCGGYKSVAVELLSSVASLSGDSVYIKDFENVFAASIAGGFKARIPLCTMRDVMYYRDLYISDEVEMVWNAGIYSYSRKINIDGEIPEVAANGTVDMNMTLRLLEVSTAW